MSRSALIVFVKNSDADDVKTRIAREVGEAKALAIYEELLITCRSLCAKIDVDVIVFYSHHIVSSDPWDNIAALKYRQMGLDLGERMVHAFQTCFLLYNKLAIIGSDCPYINTQTITTCFDALDKTDYVVGPAVDGGYYLLGMNSPEESMFKDISWSTNKVFSQTIDTIFAQKKSVAILDELEDIDYYNDYLKWKENQSVI